MKKIVKSICILGLAGILLSGTVEASSTGVVTGAKVNIRTKADPKSYEITFAKKGEKVEIIGEEGNWYHVKFENVTGYISKDYVSTDYTATTQELQPTLEQPAQTTPEPTVQETPAPVEETQTPEPEQTEQPPEAVQQENNNNYEENQEVTFAQDASLRYLPSFTSRIQATATKGATYKVKGTLNNWIKVENDNNSGWVLKASIEGTVSQPTPEQPVQTPSTPEPTVQEQPTPTEQPPATTPEVTTPAEQPEVAPTKKGKIIVKSAVMRTAPNGERVSSLPYGTEVEILGKENDWYKIKAEGYDACYMAERLIKEY